MKHVLKLEQEAPGPEAGRYIRHCASKLFVQGHYIEAFHVFNMALKLLDTEPEYELFYKMLIN